MLTRRGRERGGERERGGGCNKSPFGDDACMFSTIFNFDAEIVKTISASKSQHLHAYFCAFQKFYAIFGIFGCNICGSHQSHVFLT